MNVRLQNQLHMVKEVETDVAGLLEEVSDLDDLVLQFDGGETGKRFFEAWKCARLIVDTGGGHAGTPAPAPTPRPTPPKP